jgi:hypothetical protein
MGKDIETRYGKEGDNHLIEARVRARVRAY